MRRSLRIAGTALAAAGALVLVWVVVVWQWQDPFTALYTHWKQHQLSKSYEHRFVSYHAARYDREAAISARVRSGHARRCWQLGRSGHCSSWGRSRGATASALTRPGTWPS